MPNIFVTLSASLNEYKTSIQWTVWRFMTFYSNEHTKGYKYFWSFWQNGASQTEKMDTKDVLCAFDIKFCTMCNVDIKNAELIANSNPLKKKHKIPPKKVRGQKWILLLLFDFIRYYHQILHISTFCELWSQTRRKRHKTAKKRSFINVSKN